MPDDVKPLDPDQARSLAQVRRLMMFALMTTCVAIGLVFAVIGYKIYRSGDSAVEAGGEPVDVTVNLPAGARVVSTTIGNDHIVVTVEVGGVTELRTFDPDTLKPLGRLRLEVKP
ncbi:MAG TPA: hypothetical protein VIJ52_07965 [Pseudolabrys sp.]|nr:hypothetical protein [Pseudolabrys sp.]